MERAWVCKHHRRRFTKGGAAHPWVNQVEIWFSKIERDVISRGVFTSIPDLRRKLMNYITRYNDKPRPIRWSYVDVKHRITGPKRSFTRH
jgi:hypothetical protein